MVPFEGEIGINEFKDKPIRKVFKDGEWYFSIVDVIEAMVETASPSRYWAQLRDKLTREEGFADLFDNIEKVKMPGRDGKEYPAESCDAQTLFRIIQSVPSISLWAQGRARAD